MATRKQTKQIESVEQEQALVVPADLGQPKEFAVQVAEQSAEKPVQSAEKPVEQPAEQPADRSAGKIIGNPPEQPSLEERVEKLIDFLIYVDGCPLDSTPKETAEEFGLTLSQFNSVRRQLRSRGIEVRFMRKGRRPLIDIEKFMGDGPDEEINRQG